MKTGVQCFCNALKSLASGFHRNDDSWAFSTFYEVVKHGILKDRVVVESTNESGAVPHWDVVDLIEFKDEKEPEWIRIGYYRKPKHTLNWGSQTTITEPVSIWKRILVNAAQEKKRFRDMLEDVMIELKK